MGHRRRHDSGSTSRVGDGGDDEAQLGRLDQMQGAQTTQHLISGNLAGRDEIMNLGLQVLRREIALPK